MVTVGLSWILNFANAVLGVGLLTMPYCFQECGVLLTIMMILMCGHLTKITCQFLLRAGIYTRKSTYEQLALLVYGRTGKLICEISMIGVVVGTLIAFQVVIGDLAPSIMASEFGFQNSWMLRAVMMIACCGLVLPLTLMRNVASLASFNAISMTFYVCYIFSVFCISLSSISAMEWWTDIYFWRPAEFFKCLPIILLSYNCQGQIFIFYAALPDPNVKLMTAIVDKAINLVNTFYITVGMFGYIAFYKAGVGGNILENFTDGFFTDCMKLGFLLSVVISFPLMCFPVRSSINSLLFADKKQGVLHDVITNSSGYIAPDKFVLISLGLVSGSVTVGILIPKVEVVLSITGALAGSFICLVYPTVLFLMTGGKDKQRKFAVFVLLLSVFFLISCTSTSLSGLTSKEPVPIKPVDVKMDAQDKMLIKTELPIDKINTIARKDIKDQDGGIEDSKIEDPSPLKVPENPMDKIKAPENLIDKAKSLENLLDNVKPPENLLDNVNPPENLIDKVKAPENLMDKVKAPENLMDKLKASENLIDKEMPKEVVTLGSKKGVPDLVDIVKKQLLEKENDANKIIEEIPQKVPKNQSDKVDRIVTQGSDSNDARALQKSKKVVNHTHTPNAANSIPKSNISDELPKAEKPLEVLPIKGLPLEPPSVNKLNKVNVSEEKSVLTREILSNDIK